MEYDEGKILTDYVWSHCVDLMTEFEKWGWKTAAANEKAANAGSDVMARTITSRFGAGNDPQIVAALSNGVEEFKRVVRDRVLKDHPEIINRCPKCKKVARTPKAKQCRWCNHDWHHT